MMRAPAATSELRGLSAADVAERVRAGAVNQVDDTSSRSYRSIVAGNVLTRFNLIISTLGAVVLLVGHPADALFAIVMVLNAAIGIVQEIRAKRTLDRLRILLVPQVTVRRDGADVAVAPEQIVVDDVVLLRPGDQVPVDGVLVDAGELEVDESALTGEAEPVPKHHGGLVRSGSAVVAGSAAMRATHVGDEAWIHRLVTQAREFAPATSELRTGVDGILRIVGWVIGPLAALLLWSQLRSDQSTGEALVSAVAGVVGLVPQGLVLLVSMALAVAVVRLARDHVVVQELHAVEGLARIDVFCVDKTGTLTTGEMTVRSIETLPVMETTPDVVERAVGRLAACDPNPTTTLRVIAQEVTAQPTDTVAALHHVPFSSARKWSGATFAVGGPEHPTWILGAPEVLLEHAEPDVREATATAVGAAAATAGRAVLLASSTERLDGPVLPATLTPRALLVLSERVRSDAADTMAYFARQGVTVKVISGDHPHTVAAVARSVGIDGADRVVDMRRVDVGDDRDHDDNPVDAGFARLVEETTIFGRVLPEQKRAIVAALQANGHTVAMTGDGVNDIPAVKRADIGVAMDTATAATKAVAQVVLLDGRFDRMPHVVAEGRRVVENMERVSKLFVTKTVYAAVFALTIGLSGAIFPFLPRQMSLVSELTIGVPAFFLSFRSASRPCRPGYRRRVFRFALPAGLAASAVTLLAYWTARLPTSGADLDQARTASTLALVGVACWVLVELMRPLDRLDAVLLAALAAIATVTFGVAPVREFYRLAWPPPLVIAATALIVAGGVAVAQIASGILRRR